MPSFFQSTDSIVVKASQEKVYQALTDWEERSRWRKGIAIEWEGDSKAYAGQKVAFKVKGPMPYSFSFSVAGLEPPRRLFMEYSGHLRGRGAVEITPQEGGSLVSFHWMKVEPSGFWPWLFFAIGFGMRTHRRRTRETLAMLKQYLETKPTQASRREDAKKAPEGLNRVK